MKITIGKAADNDFVADHAEVSRHHACLVREDDGGYTLEDLGSTNGTKLQNTDLIPNSNYLLKKGQIIEIGFVKFRVE